MKTKSNLSSRQEALKIKHNLSVSRFHQMLEPLASLTSAERATLKDPDFITEDEADLIICDRRHNEPTFPLDEVLKEMASRRAGRPEDLRKVDSLRFPSTPLASGKRWPDYAG